MFGFSDECQMQYLNWCLATNVRFFRRKKGWSQCELAHYAKVSRRAVQLIEAEKGAATILTIHCIADALGVDWTDLVLLQRVTFEDPISQMRKIDWGIEGFQAGFRLPNDILANASTNFKEITGRSSSDMEGRHIKELVDEGYVNSLKERNQKSQAGFGFIASVDYNSPNGPVPATLSIVPAFDPDLNLLGTFGVVTRSEIWPCVSGVEKFKLRFLGPMLGLMRK